MKRYGGPSGAATTTTTQMKPSHTKRNSIVALIAGTIILNGLAPSPKVESKSVTGIYNRIGATVGIEAGIINQSESSNYGGQLGAWNLIDEAKENLDSYVSSQAGLVNDYDGQPTPTKYISVALQAGFMNSASNLSGYGVQLGIFNNLYTRPTNTCVVQIGLFNNALARDHKEYDFGLLFQLTCPDRK